MYNRSVLCFLVCDGQLGMVTRGTQDRPREMEFLILTGPRSRKHRTSSRATWGRLLELGARKQEQRGNPNQSLYWAFLRNGKAGRGKHVRTD